jgi:peptide/nickel transport system substrate-binding protein
LKEKVSRVEIVDPRVIRFHLKEVWPDFMTFYGSTASASGLVVPKKYFTQVGEDGFKKHPVGAGPYKFVSDNPGIEVVLEAFPQYWRHPPRVKTIIMRSVPDSTARALMVRTGEADIAYALQGIDAQGVVDDPKTRVVATKHASCQWVEFADQFDPNSPWHDQRLRLAVNYALDRDGINNAGCLGFCPPAEVIIPRPMEFVLDTKPYPYDPEQGEGAARRCRLSEWHRRRSLSRHPRLPDRRRGGGQ